MPQAKDGGIVVSDGHILFVPAKRIWKVVALRKCAGGTFLAKTAAAMPRGGKLLRPTCSPLFENSPSAEIENGAVPHNESLNLRVHTSFAAQDAAASRRLFGATGISLVMFPCPHRAAKPSPWGRWLPEGQTDEVYSKPCLTL